MESSALGDALPEPRVPFAGSVPSVPAIASAVTAPIAWIDWRVRYRWALVGTDTAVIALSLAFAQSVRFSVSPFRIFEMLDGYSVLGVAIGLLWLGALAAIHSRESRLFGVGGLEYQRVAQATFVTFGTVAVAAVLLKENIARGYLLVALPVGLGALLLSRFFWRSWLIARRREGRCLTGAFVVGDRTDATLVTKQLLKHRQAGYKPVGVALTDGTDWTRDIGPEGGTVPAVDFDRLPDAVRAAHAHAVILAGELPGGRQQVQDLSWRLENSKTELILVSRLTDVAGPRIHMRPVEGLPMLHVDLPQYAGMNHTIKRGIDIVLGGLAFLLLSPVIGIVALAVRLESPGPVLFRQRRIGVAGEPFTMFKFRSMVTDAETRFTDVVAGNEGAGLLFKMRADPRVTRVGRILRQFSLDELPQLFNVLNGSMSLIGPRPPLPREVAAYEGRVNRRLLIKPGITGLWQVSGRSNLSWEESVKLDLYYVENWSVTTDFIILLKTVRAVLTRNGAY
jgi:exopolysaccharide biosynthesis polyprenyl glycosylphosphotransferase